MNRHCVFLSIAIMCAFLPLYGCSGLISKVVDSQPRVNLNANDYGKPAQIVKGKPVYYHLNNKQEMTGVDRDLVKYAPIIVQGFQDDTHAIVKYDVTGDAFGVPLLSNDGKQVSIQTDKPTIYSRVEYAEVQGVRLKQLVYVLWYPRRPVGSVETGNIDGNVLRITLDVVGRPAIFEATQTCGCFHGVFVANHVEQWASMEFPMECGTQMYHVEKLTEDATSNWIIRDLVEVDTHSRPVVYYSAGTHLCQAIKFESFIPTPSVSTKKQYEIQPYQQLTSIQQVHAGTGSMFDAHGLVKGAKRWKEEVLLSDLNHPGWPRHLDQMMIHWDKDKWTDAHLIEKHLNVSQKMLDRRFVGDIEVDKEKLKSTRFTNAVLTKSLMDKYSNRKPYVLLVSNKYCAGCQEVKENVLTADKVKSVITKWNYLVIDTVHEEEANLAARYRVIVTPVIIVFDTEGKEIFRSENIMTVDEMLESLNHAASLN